MVILKLGVFLLFGYIRPFKPQMKFCEYDAYKAVYCGLCKETGKSFGFLLRFTLSYDFAFVGLISLALAKDGAEITPQRCVAHPLKKTPCLACTGRLHFTAAAASMLVYHKLKDDISDRGFLSKTRAILLLPLIYPAYKKAKKNYPEIAALIEKSMKKQSELEKQNCKSIDLAAEPTAEIISAVAEKISDDEKQKRILKRMGYLLGRYVYIIDALNDAKDDYKKKNYNPFLLREYGFDMEKIRAEALDSINFTLGELANTYSLLDLERFKPILDNIIYLGLQNTFMSVLNEKELSK